jgi:hypothetical protein
MELMPAPPLAHRNTMKNGAPRNAVTTPIGVSPPCSNARPGTSARIRNEAPTMMLIGSTQRYDELNTRRTRCGTTMPTNPISPLTLTTAAVPKVAATTTTRRTRRTSAPNVAASSSPTRSTSRWRRCSSSTTVATTTYGSTSRTSPHVAVLNRPLIQLYTSSITSLLRSSTNCCTAVHSAATATPDSTRVSPVPPNDAPNA